MSFATSIFKVTVPKPVPSAPTKPTAKPAANSALAPVFRSVRSRPLSRF